MSPLSTPAPKIVNSATETLTNEIDIDGYPVYKKVLTGSLSIAVGFVNIAHGITGLRALVNSHVTFEFATSVMSNTGKFGSYREAGGNSCQLVTFDATNVSLVASYAWSTSAYRITLWYTKN